MTFDVRWLVSSIISSSVHRPLLKEQALLNGLPFLGASIACIAKVRFRNAIQAPEGL